MENIISKINKEKVFNLIIILIVIALYIVVGMFIYSSFRERKRSEITHNIIEKVDKQIEEIIRENNDSNNNNNNHVTIDEIKVEYNNIEYTVLGKINIKKINIYEPILKENTKGAYDVSAVKISGPRLNDYGNVTIGGHNYMKGNFFIKINKLVKDDIITITDLTGNSVDYYVYDYGITTIDDANYLAQPNSKVKQITLVTCTKGGKQRYFVKARAK